MGLTCITSTWANGEAGPMGLCISNGFISQADIIAINNKWPGQFFVMESGTESHFMTADTVVQFFRELIGPVPQMKFWVQD